MSNVRKTDISHVYKTCCYQKHLHIPLHMHIQKHIPLNHLPHLQSGMWFCFFVKKDILHCTFRRPNINLKFTPAMTERNSESIATKFELEITIICD